MTFQPCKAEKMALDSWYFPDNLLYLNPHHPLLGLAGETGEVLNLYKKHLYKPNFIWDDKIIEEIADCSYYLRIICFQQGVSFEMLCDGYTPFTACLEELLNDLAYRSIKLHKMWLKTQKVNPSELQILTFIFLTILERLEVSLEEVLDLNYKKLNSEETQHGWSAAR